jgi:hypothetical protein
MYLSVVGLLEDDLWSHVERGAAQARLLALLI